MYGVPVRRTMPRAAPAAAGADGSVYRTMLAFALIILVITGVHVWNVRPQPMVYTHVCRSGETSTEGYGAATAPPPNTVDDAVNRVLRDRQQRRAASGGLAATNVTYI